MTGGALGNMFSSLQVAFAFVRIVCWRSFVFLGLLLHQAIALVVSTDADHL